MAWFAIAAAALSAASQLKQGNEAAAMGDWQARQAAADAQAEREAGQVRADQVRKQGARDRSSAVASLAGSGIDVGAGTPVVIDQAIVRNNEEDALTQILYGNRQGTRLDQQGELARLAGRNRQMAGFLGAGGSLMSAYTMASRGWTGPQQAPAPVYDAQPSGGAIRIR